MDADTDSTSMERGARRGVCCQKCLASETAELRMKVCSRCKAVHYCSAECQKEHWKEHKPVCNDRIERIAKAKDELGAEFVKAYNTWAHQGRAGLTHLVHAVLPPSKVRTHVAYVETLYQPEVTPQFKIVSYKAMTLAELRGINEELCDSIAEHIETTLPKLEGSGKGMAWGYVVAMCRNTPMARIIPCGLETGLKTRTARPEEIVMAMNMGVLQYF